jgi:hypothetical protein
MEQEQATIPPRAISRVQTEVSCCSAKLLICCTAPGCTVVVPRLCRQYANGRYQVQFEFLPWQSGIAELVEHGQADLVLQIDDGVEERTIEVAGFQVGGEEVIPYFIRPDPRRSKPPKQTFSKEVVEQGKVLYEAHLCSGRHSPVLDGSGGWTVNGAIPDLRYAPPQVHSRVARDSSGGDPSGRWDAGLWSGFEVSQRQEAGGARI